MAGRKLPLHEMTDKQLLNQAGWYGIQAFVSQALKSFGRAEAEKVLSNHIANGGITRHKAIRNSHKKRIVAKRGTKCECCGSNDWTDICHIKRPDPDNASSGVKEIQKLMTQSNWAKVEELLSRCWLGCITCHKNWDGVWTKTHERSWNSFREFQPVQRHRVHNGLKTRNAAAGAKAVAGNRAQLKALYDPAVCQCCQQTRPTQYAHVYGEEGKERNVTQLINCSQERCLNEARKCISMCRECHCSYDKANCYTGTQNPTTLEQHCRDMVERLDLGIEGHRKLDNWMDKMHERLEQVKWPQCELPVGYYGEDDPKPKCPSAKDFALGMKDPGYEIARKKYSSLLTKWNHRNKKDWATARQTRARNYHINRRKEDRWA